MKRLTIEEFKEQGTAKFSGKFDYSRVTIIHSLELVPIKCPVHGWFEMIPRLHLKSKNGCRKCGGVEFDRDGFIRKSKKVFEQRLDYSQMVHDAKAKRVTLYCTRHRIQFSVKVHRHLKALGGGCPSCKEEEKTKQQREKGQKRLEDKGNEIFGGVYGYEKAEYINNATPVTIICRKCWNEFKKTPANHLKLKKPQGCPTCQAKEKRETSLKNQERLPKNTSRKRHRCGVRSRDYLKRLLERNGEHFEYPDFEYRGVHEKIKVRHKSCGEEYYQELNSALKGTGCPRCSGNKKKTTEEYVAEATQVWGEKSKYSYEHTRYQSTHKKVIIQCNVAGHGPFQQTANSHLIKLEGCPECKGNTTRSFIKKSQEKFGDRFGYSEVIYKGSKVDVTIMCPVHGNVSVTPTDHLRGGCTEGCPKCRKDKRLTTESFIERAIKEHGDRYDYRKVDCQGSDTIVTIICPSHGEFTQRARNHLTGSGCRTCNESLGERKVDAALKKLGVKFTREETFEGCKHKNLLPFDFKVVVGSTLGLIEYHGAQHYKSVAHFEASDGRGSLEERKFLDKIKEDYCTKNDIPLLVISHESLKEVAEKVTAFIQMIRER